MHTSFLNRVVSARAGARAAGLVCRRRRRRARWLIALACWALLTSRALLGQTFVAEWAEPDIDRLGPTGMAVDTVGGISYLYVSDQNHGRVIKFNLATGTRAAVWGRTGNADGEFNSPFGIAIDPQTHDLYVAERSNHRITRITNSGTFVMKWGEGGSGPGQMNGPIGVAADAAGHVYVTDHNNQRVHKFAVRSTPGGWVAQHVTTWGGPGAGPGQFNGPYGITLDAGGILWVADGFNHRLQKFDSDGRFLDAVGTFGTGDGQFVTPTWVAFDAAGSYFVAETNSDPTNPAAPDRQNQRIQKFSASGAFETKWGSWGEAGGQFRLPFQVAIDGGHAYVSDYYNTRVQKFSLSGAPTGPATPPPTPPPSRFVNLSSRLHTLDGDTNRAFIAGFVVAGSAPKAMLVRAVGPGLAPFGVDGALANPRLQIVAGAEVVAESEDWADTAAMRAATERVGAFQLAPGGRDAALLVTLAPGNYSAHVLANGGAGVALVEVYDAEAAQPATQLINLSTRGYVDTGDSVLVAGFVVTGDAPKRVLVRGIGPALGSFGVSGALADCKLELFGGGVLLAQNNDWGTPLPIAGAGAPASAADIAAAGVATGAFALTAGSRDAAVLVTLPPGAYSAIVSGVAGATGAGLVEVYEAR